jgi:hypothetical protein
VSASDHNFFGWNCAQGLDEQAQAGYSIEKPVSPTR